MKKYVWQVLALALVAGGWSTVQAGMNDAAAPSAAPSATGTEATDTTTPATDPALKTDSKHKSKKHHRRAEGTNRSSRPGTTTGVHAVGGNDTPAPMGVPQGTDTSTKTTPSNP